jgi:predicted nucleic acid-binding protein
MGVGAAVAVVDAGPIIHLTEISALTTLTGFGKLYLPQAVWIETVERRRISADSLADFQLNLHSPNPTDVIQFARMLDLSALHRGEQECLFLCKHLNVSLLLTDDLAARDAAKRLGLKPIGSLGVVVRAYHNGCISLKKAEKHISDFYSVSSLFVTRDIVEMAIQLLRTAR